MKGSISMRETWDFGVLLTSISEGELREEITDELKALVEELYERSQASARTVKGVLNITLEISVSSNGMLAISPNVAGKLPKKIRKDTPFWVGVNGLTQDNPKQQKLFREVKEVGVTRVVKEPGERAEGE
jgi:hypothetical protein